MKTWILLAASSMLLGSVLAGCAQDGSGGMSKTSQGALIGGASGGLLGGIFGHNGTSAVIGAAAGALLGGIIGKEMDDRDREARQAALQQALQTSQNNQPRQWKNTKTGHSGTIKPLNGYAKSPSAQTCRDFTETYQRDGKQYEQTSKACRNANGEWQLASQ
ncbi:RT0821/Lpp0805 family surface protein [Paraburkholderia sp. C35]|uniref:RT0821/Lpp0805 family surface protein n=1 Tax=Paraburkholderia sp. C35 TaxID=2126993 RepID=UPI0013A54A86|nr:RT0821/Lpp0805 family surface protein [Paraburkholderia sp. C35]